MKIYSQDLTLNFFNTPPINNSQEFNHDQFGQFSWKKWFSERSSFVINSLSTLTEIFRLNMGREGFLMELLGAVTTYFSSTPALQEQGQHFMTLLSTQPWCLLLSQVTVHSLNLSVLLKYGSQKRSFFVINRLSTFTRIFQLNLGREGFLMELLGAVTLHFSSTPALQEQGQHFMTHLGILLFIIYQEICIFILYLLVKILLEHIDNQNRN